MKKIYITGCIISGLLFLPECWEERCPLSFIYCTTTWPLSVLLLLSYYKYLIVGSYMHKRMVLAREGFCAEMSDERYAEYLKICKYTS